MTDKTLFLVLQTALSFAEHCNSNAEWFCLDLQQHKDRTIYLSLLWCAINRKDTESENTCRNFTLDQAGTRRKKLFVHNDCELVV